VLPPYNSVQAQVIKTATGPHKYPELLEAAADEGLSIDAEMSAFRGRAAPRPHAGAHGEQGDTHPQGPSPGRDSGAQARPAGGGLAKEPDLLYDRRPLL